jgi:hypothetical protein
MIELTHWIIWAMVETVPQGCSKKLNILKVCLNENYSSSCVFAGVVGLLFHGPKWMISPHVVNQRSDQRPIIKWD